jgi:hypothetical protein
LPITLSVYAFALVSDVRSVLCLPTTALRAAFAGPSAARVREVSHIIRARCG